MAPSASNKALNTIPPQFSSWRRVKVYGSVGACKTFPPCVKELSLKQVGVNMCEPFMSLADIYFFFFFFPPHCSGSLGAYCTVRQIRSMKTTPIPLLTPIVSSDCYDTVTLVGAETGNKSSLQRLKTRERHWRGELGRFFGRKCEKQNRVD